MHHDAGSTEHSRAPTKTRRPGDSCAHAARPLDEPRRRPLGILRCCLTTVPELADRKGVEEIREPFVVIGVRMGQDHNVDSRPPAGAEERDEGPQAWPGGAAAPVDHHRVAVRQVDDRGVALAYIDECHTEPIAGALREVHFGFEPRTRARASGPPQRRHCAGTARRARGSAPTVATAPCARVGGGRSRPSVASERSAHAIVNAASRCSKRPGGHGVEHRGRGRREGVEQGGGSRSTAARGASTTFATTPTMGTPPKHHQTTGAVAMVARTLTRVAARIRAEALASRGGRAVITARVAMTESTSPGRGCGPGCWPRARRWP